MIHPTSSTLEKVQCIILAIQMSLDRFHSMGCVLSTESHMTYQTCLALYKPAQQNITEFGGSPVQNISQQANHHIMNMKISRSFMESNIIYW